MITVAEIRTILNLPDYITDEQIQIALNASQSYIKNILGIYEQEDVDIFLDRLPDVSFPISPYINITDFDIALIDGLNYNTINEENFDIKDYGIVKLYNNIDTTIESKKQYKISYKSGYLTLSDIQKNFISGMVREELRDKIDSYNRIQGREIIKEKVLGDFEVTFSNNSFKNIFAINSYNTKVEYYMDLENIIKRIFK